MLVNNHKFENSHVWLDVGLDYDNSRHYINVRKSYQNMTFVSALYQEYAFTGCDYISSFLRKGKKRPIEIMRKEEVFKCVQQP